MERFTIGVIISTYNNPKWLEKTLWGYMCQSRPADEIIVADDGSGPETKALIEAYMGKLPISHVWHEDKGFRKTRILNVALLRSKADYLHRPRLRAPPRLHRHARALRTLRAFPLGWIFPLADGH